MSRGVDSVEAVPGLRPHVDAVITDFRKQPKPEETAQLATTAANGDRN